MGGLSTAGGWICASRQHFFMAMSRFTYGLAYESRPISLATKYASNPWRMRTSAADKFTNPSAATSPSLISTCSMLLMAQIKACRIQQAKPSHCGCTYRGSTRRNSMCRGSRWAPRRNRWVPHNERNREVGNPDLNPILAHLKSKITVFLHRPTVGSRPLGLVEGHGAPGIWM